MKISLSLGIQTWDNALTSWSSFVYMWLSWLHTRGNQSEGQLDSYLGTLGRMCFQAYLSCWQNLVLGSCMMGVAIFLLAVGGASLSSPRNFPQILSCGSFYLNVGDPPLCSSHTLNLIFSFATSWRKLVAFMQFVWLG